MDKPELWTLKKLLDADLGKTAIWTTKRLKAKVEEHFSHTTILFPDELPKDIDTLIVIGGGGKTAGAVMGVVFLRLISQVLRTIGSSSLIPLSSNDSVYITYAIYGLIIILFISFRPNGLISVWQKIKLNYKRWPFGV